MNHFKAIYATTGSRDWIPVAKKLHQDHGLYPEYWITHDLQDEVDNTFDNSIIHDAHDAIEGRFPYKPDSGPLYEPLDAELLTDLAKHESIALEMMNREDRRNKTKVNYTYQDRISQYHTQVSYWLSIVKEIDPDVVIFGATPHLVYDYILYAVCDYLGVKTILFTHTSLPNRFIVKSSISEDPICDAVGEESNTISAESQSYIKRIQNDYEAAEPEYMRTSLKNKLISQIDNTRKMYRDFISFVAQKINNPDETDYRISGKIKNGAFLIMYPRYYKWKLSNRYTKNTSNISLSSDYIYFPLHYQPERTTSPEGGLYTHQELAIKLVSSAIPERYNIYIKEHPSQFNSDLHGEQGRSLDYYEKLKKIDSVELVPMDSDPFALIDNAEAVATITGTAGWEALVRGTPAIVFGNAWYRSAQNCHNIVNLQDIHKSLKNIIQGNQDPKYSIKQFVSAVESASYKGDLSTEMDENVQSYYSGVCEKMNFEI